MRSFMIRTSFRGILKVKFLKFIRTYLIVDNHENDHKKKRRAGENMLWLKLIFSKIAPVIAAPSIITA